MVGHSRLRPAQRSENTVGFGVQHGRAACVAGRGKDLLELGQVLQQQVARGGAEVGLDTDGVLEHLRQALGVPGAAGPRAEIDDGFLGHEGEFFTQRPRGFGFRKRVGHVRIRSDATEGRGR